MNILFERILDVLFPPQCVLCEQNTLPTDEFESLCDSCFCKIKTQTGFSCVECEKRIPDLTSICHKKNFLLVSACDYNAPSVKKIIHSFKYERIHSLAVPLSRLVATALSTVINAMPFKCETALLTTIPLSRGHFRERGFNQSDLIAKELIQYIPELEIDTNILKRKKQLSAQAHIHSRKERIARIQNSFVANKKEKENIILIDDVLTTGATVEDAVRTLKEAGYKRIVVATIARTSRNRG